MGLEGFEEAYPKEFSGGMKQRVGIARALAAGRNCFAWMSRFSALDVFTAESLEKRSLSALVGRRERSCRFRLRAS